LQQPFERLAAPASVVTENAFFVRNVIQTLFAQPTLAFSANGTGALIGFCQPIILGGSCVLIKLGNYVMLRQLHLSTYITFSVVQLV
jgi:hypothetical protein